MSPSKDIILVTGGTGLIGKAIEDVLNSSGPYGKRCNEEWIFSSSADADLRFVIFRGINI
jgi:GDP-L-fucose synthase